MKEQAGTITLFISAQYLQQLLLFEMVHKRHFFSSFLIARFTRKLRFDVKQMIIDLSGKQPIPFID